MEKILLNAMFETCRLKPVTTFIDTIDQQKMDRHIHQPSGHWVLDQRATFSMLSPLHQRQFPPPQRQPQLIESRSNNNHGICNDDFKIRGSDFKAVCLTVPVDHQPFL
jgi:hypothetical protein